MRIKKTKGKLQGSVRAFVHPSSKRPKSNDSAKKTASPSAKTMPDLERFTTKQYLDLTLKFASATVRSFRRSHRQLSNAFIFVTLFVLLFSIYLELFRTQAVIDTYEIRSLGSVLEAPIAPYSSRLVPDPETGVITFNQDYAPGAEVAGDNFSPRIEAEFTSSPDYRVSVKDPIADVGVSFTPQFEVEAPQKDQNRVVYPVVDQDAVVVYTTQGTGLKQDIVLREKPLEDELSYEYQLNLPDGLEARLQENGSIDVYGVKPILLGDVATSTPEDAELLEQARQNSEKNEHLFSIPAPFIVEPGRRISDATASFTLDGSKLTLHAKGLSEANYPLSIDPTIYVESARELMRGNNETNTDFDVDNELIQKSQTTGARIDSWQTNLDITEPVWGHATAAAGGYVYRTGGRTADTTIATPPIIESSVESLQNSNSSNFTMSMPGTRPAGDLYIAIMCHDGQSASDDVSTAPSGWTEVANLQNNYAAYYKIGTDEGGGSEAASYTWQWGSNEKAGGVIMRVTGFDATTPVSPTPTTNSGSSSTPTAPAITPDEDNTLIIRSYGIDNDEIGNSGWAPTGHTSVAFGGSTGSGDCAYAVATDDSPPASGVSSGTANMQSGYVNDTYGSSTIAVNPDTSSGSLPATVDTVEWAQFNSSTLEIEEPTPSNTGSACASWCNETVYDLPEERRNHSMVSYNGYLYVIGGQDGSDNVESTIYISKLGANGEPSLWHPTDTNPDNWVYWYTDTGLSSARTYLSAVAYNNRMYVLGGKTSTTASASGITTVQQADILPNGRLGSWTTTGMQALPSGAGNYMADVQVYNDTLYTVGGFEGGSNSSSNLRDTVYYSRLDTDGTMNAWQSTEPLISGARANFGGVFTYIWGAYIYTGGGCTATDSNGYCTTLATDSQLASINADGSLGEWASLGSLDNTRIGYNFIAWQGGLYRLGGCVAIETTGGECTSALADVDYGVINPAGEVSTVIVTDEDGEGSCVDPNPQDCDLPDTGDGAGQGGQMLSSSIIVNGYLYVIGGCTNFGCSGSSGNISYTSIGSDGSLQKPASCIDSFVGSWCVDSTNRVNSTTGISAAGITQFNGRIYLVGGIDETADGVTAIHYNDLNDDGSLDGAWESDTFASVGITGEKAYTYAYARANPATASTVPGNLYVIGGCSAISASAGCSSSYNTEVYKCDIEDDGTVSNCTTSGQLQLDVELGDETNQGLGLHSGTVYANYIYLIGGYSDNVGDRDTVFYARFDDSNNIVDVESGTAILGLATDDWIESGNTLEVGRRRGWAFGYNGHIYAVGGYNASGAGVGGLLPFIEWAKEDVSDGSIDPFVTSSVEIRQRWGLSMAVSSSYAYVIGGCDVGSSPGGCSSFEPSVQTFQLYNNSSGTPANYSASTNQFNVDRYGGSAAVLNGYIYLAGGCTDNAGDCSSATNSVQFASLDANGDIGTWKSAAGNLPEARGWGQLETAGDSLYWVGGQDGTGDEKTEVYYATPETTTGSASDVIRTTQYKLPSSGEYSGQTYTLTLNNDLEENYFVMISGAVDVNAGRGADENQIRVDRDPHGNFGSSTSSNQLRFTRGSGATDDWNGAITVVECLDACGSDGFELKEVLDVSLAAGTANALQTTNVDLTENYTSRTVPFGGYLGGGVATESTASADFSPTAGVRIQRNASDAGQLTIERYGAQSRTPQAADVTVYVVEWGGEWNVQETHFDDWSPPAGNASDLDLGCDDGSPEYECNTITSVTRDDTWVWKSPGTSTDNGSGDGAFGKVVTIGDGVEPQAATETQVAISAQRDETYRDTVYVLEHEDIDVDYRRDSISASPGTTITEAVDGANGTESYDTVSSVNTTEGYRAPLFYYATETTGNLPRTAGYGHYHTASGVITAEQNFQPSDLTIGWWQSVDFANLSYTPSVGDIQTWTAATNGLPAGRTQFGAASWNDRIYVVAGINASGSETNEIYISPQLSSGGNITSSWTTETTNVPDVARSGNAVVAYANNLYSLGGYDGTNYLLDSQFTQINTDGSLDAWTFTTQLPNPMRQGDAFASNGYIYVVGGRSDDTTCLSHTYVAPISANTTIATGNNPTGVGEWYETNVRYTGNRYGNAAAYDRGRLYALGGTCDAGFPDILSADTESFTTAAATHDVDMPALVGEGDLLIVTLTTDGNATVTTPSGWTEISTTANGTSVRASVYAKEAEGIEGGTTVNFVTSATEEASSAVVRISASDWFGGDVSQAVETATATGSTSTPNAPSLNPTNWGTEDTLWIAYAAGSSYDSVTSYPTNYSEVGHVTSGGTAGGSVSLAYRNNNAASEDPGTFTMNASQSVVAVTIGVRPNSNNGFTDSYRTSQTTLLSQPQVAKYSRMMDTDSDVFPNSWLLNGLDNSIGARWQVRYRSMNDTDGVATDCGTADMTTWGQETDYGDVTLGDVATYTPLDGSGANTNCARYFYFFISIDASQTFGYPEDVNRGPTIADLSLFFTSDPNKRLRHGKTFTGGEQQPLDTPCRQSVDSDCPLP